MSGSKIGGVLLIGLGGYLFVKFFFDLSSHELLAASGAMLLAGLIGSIIGYPAGYIASRNSDTDETIFKVFAWANLVGWLIPVVGATVAAATHTFARNADEHRYRYLILYNLGFLLVSINAGWGAVAAHRYNNHAEQIVKMGGDPYAPRSTERCRYAARDGWTREEVIEYCS